LRPLSLTVFPFTYAVEAFQGAAHAGPPLPGVGLEVAVAVGAPGVLVRVAVRVAVGPAGVFVRVAVDVDPPPPQAPIGIQGWPLPAGPLLVAGSFPWVQ
jgi:hypothetical protein